MYNASYAGRKASCSYIWRYSPKHKFHFDFQDATKHGKQPITTKSFDRIFHTALEYLGGFPEAPEIQVFPNSVRLFNKEEK
jgi:hypothetical protein